MFFKTRSKPSAGKHVAGFAGQGDGQSIEFLGHDDLASEPRGGGQAKGQVQHILFVLASLLKALVIVLADDHVAGGTGQGSLASTLDVNVVTVGDLEHGQAAGCIYFAARSVNLDKDNSGHLSWLDDIADSTVFFQRQNQLCGNFIEWVKREKIHRSRSGPFRSDC